MRSASTSVITSNAPFVLAEPGSSTSVISFLGDIDSYVLLTNNGEFAVSSFTWVAKVFPESADDDPLFNWEINNLQCGHHGPHIWIVGAKLWFCVCTTGGLSSFMQSVIITTNQWHDLAVSYDANTGVVQLSTDGFTESNIIGISRPGDTDGPVLIGSRYYHSGHHYDSRTFQGRLACMRLWNVVRDLNTLRMDSPLCQI